MNLKLSRMWFSLSKKIEHPYFRWTKFGGEFGYRLRFGALTREHHPHLFRRDSTKTRVKGRLRLLSATSDGILLCVKHCYWCRAAKYFRIAERNYWPLCIEVLLTSRILRGVGGLSGTTTGTATSLKAWWLRHGPASQRRLYKHRTCCL